MRNLSYLFLFILSPAISIFSQDIELPKNPLKGRIIFEEKGCVECHAVSGYGGTIGPDLSKGHYYSSFFELASILWNHIPQMDRKYRQQKLARPKFTENEMLNLTGFLYYLRYLGEPGSVANGKRLIGSKGCISCHKVAGKGGEIGPDFNKIQQYASPLYMVQTMWNHGPGMIKMIKEKGMKFPNLSGKDIVDIIAYIRELNIDKMGIRMSPGDPIKGKEVFKQKKCLNCHSTGSENIQKAPNLHKIDLNKSVTEIAALMWNHSPTMNAFMKKEKLDWPIMKGEEMADLIAYLYFLNFIDKAGNPQKGEMIFSQKGCTDCHVINGKGIGPDLTKLKRLDSPVRMIQLMWNHAPQMEDILLSQNKEWPKLTAEEIQNLFTFLNKVTRKK